MSLVSSLIRHAFTAHPPTPFCSDTRARAHRRALLDAAALLGAHVRVGLTKLDGTLRHITALPVLDADPTCRYYTVQDLELSDKAQRVVYRRINLDTLAALSVDYKAAA